VADVEVFQKFLEDLAVADGGLAFEIGGELEVVDGDLPEKLAPLHQPSRILR
jgi:hypothetical protein